MLKTILVTTSLAAGLLMFDVAQPTLTGNYAEAAQHGGGRPAFRPAPRPAPRMARPPQRMARPAQRMARPAVRANVQRARPSFARPKSNFGKPKFSFRPKASPKFSARPKFNPKPMKQQVSPSQKKGGPGGFGKNTLPGQQKGPGGLSKGPGGIGKGGAGGIAKGGLKGGPGLGGKPVGPGLGGLKNPVTKVKIADKFWPVWKGPHKIWWAGGWKTFLPLTAISTVLIGGAYYYPDSYISIARPYCSGVTPDGCQLNWQEVAFEGGGSEYQCVSYCQRPGMPPPARAVSLVTAPPVPSGGRCEVEIFSGPQFSGLNAPTDVNQPTLVDAGWKDQISSIQVKAGTWDFFSEDEFAGENMRLPPGPYPDLGPDWTKRIGSFMCVQGG